jgi:signal transduction histidine kinase
MNQDGRLPIQNEPGGAIDGNDLAYLTSAVLHEINNSLNGISLHLAVMEQKGASAAWASEMSAMRQEVTAAGARARRLQELCHSGPSALEPVDLNRLVGGIVEIRRRQDPGLDLHVTLAPNLPPVQATPMDLNRLVGLLVQDAAAALETGVGRITIATALEERGIELRVTDTGMPLAPGSDSRLFEPFAPGRTNADNLRLCLCKALVKRLQGDIRAENLANGAVAMIVRLQPTV